MAAQGRYYSGILMAVPSKVICLLFAVVLAFVPLFSGRALRAASTRAMQEQPAQAPPPSQPAPQNPPPAPAQAPLQIPATPAPPVTAPQPPPPPPKTLAVIVLD